MNYLESLKQQGYNIDLNEDQKQLYAKYARSQRMFNSNEFDDEEEKQTRLAAVEKLKQSFENSLSKSDQEKEKSSNGSMFGFLAFLGAVGLGVLFALTGNSEQKK